MKKYIYEIFDELEAAQNDQDRKAILFYNRSFELESVLQGMFGPTEFLVEEPTNYQPSDAPVGLGYSTIQAELAKAYLFVKNDPKAPAELTKQKRQQLFIQSLEALEAREAEVYLNMFMKRNPVKGLTKELVKEVFPHLY